MRKICLLSAILCFSYSAPAFSGESLSGTCGENCFWVFDGNGTLDITGSGEMTDYSYKRVGTTWAYQDSDGNPIPWLSLKSSIKHVNVSGVSSISAGAFKEYKNIENVNLSDSVTSIGTAAFLGNKLTEITIPNSVVTIGNSAFYGNKLSTVTLGDHLVSIGETAFDNGGSKRSLLETVVIPAALSDMTMGGLVFGNADEASSNVKFYCEGSPEDCEGITTLLGNYKGIGTAATPRPISAEVILLAKEEQCSSDNYYWSGEICNNGENGVICADNYFMKDGYCTLDCGEGYTAVGGSCQQNSTSTGGNAQQSGGNTQQSSIGGENAGNTPGNYSEGRGLTRLYF